MEEYIDTNTQKSNSDQVQNKVMLITFFDVHAEFLPECQTITRYLQKHLAMSDVLSEREENCEKLGHSCFVMTMLQLIMPW